MATLEEWQKQVFFFKNLSQTLINNRIIYFTSAFCLASLPWKLFSVFKVLSWHKTCQRSSDHKSKRSRAGGTQFKNCLSQRQCNVHLSLAQNSWLDGWMAAWLAIKGQTQHSGQTLVNPFSLGPFWASVAGNCPQRFICTPPPHTTHSTL